MERISTIRPGYLISLKTAIRGNVTYKVRGKGKSLADNQETVQWETTRRTRDVEEYNRAYNVRSKARGLVTAATIDSDFGLLCREADREQVLKAIAEGRALVRAFNNEARVTNIAFRAIMGKVAADDAEAVRSITGEIKDLLSAMTRGMADMDVKRIRDAANKATRIASMLPENASARVRDAIATARKEARRVAKAGNDAAIEIDRAAIKAIREQQTAFFDLDDIEQVKISAARGYGFDLDSGADDVKVAARSNTSYDVE